MLVKTLSLPGVQSRDLLTKPAHRQPVKYLEGIQPDNGKKKRATNLTNYTNCLGDAQLGRSRKRWPMWGERERDLPSIRAIRGRSSSNKCEDHHKFPLGLTGYP
jgi:hypothetical protein